MAAALFASGVSAFRATSYETAIELFTEAINEDSSQAKFFDARANAYEKVGKLKDALMDARQVVKLTPTSHKGFLRAGKLFRMAEKWEHSEKMLQQGLPLAQSNPKASTEIETELRLTRDLRRKAEFSPFARLPSELFIEIISFAIARPSDFTAVQSPRVKPYRPHTLLAARAVSRTWASTIINAPRLWSTLRLDGEINLKNLEKKALGWAQKSLGRRPGQQRVHGEDGPGIQELCITAAQEISPITLQDLLLQLFTMGAFKSLRHLTISFVDGNRTTESARREAKTTSDTLSFLHTHLRQAIQSLTLCTGSRLYPDFEIASFYYAFPSLHSLRLWGATHAGTVAGVRSDFLSRYNVTKDDEGACAERAPTQARHLSVNGAVLVADTACRLADFPRLEELDIDVVGAATIWELLSTPRLKMVHAVVYGEQHAVELPSPDVASAWSRVESLKLGGAKRLAPRLLDQAVRSSLTFPNLTHLDLAFASLDSAQLALFDFANAPNLTSLALPSTTSASPSGVVNLPQLTSLRSIDLSHTLWTTDATIRSLIALAPNLEQLSAMGAINLSGRPLMELVNARMEPSSEGSQPPGMPVSKLAVLKVEGCSKLEPQAVEWLQKHLKRGFRFKWLDPLDKSRRKGSWD